MPKFYLSPTSWDIDGYRGIYTKADIKNLPEDWNADETDCIYLGDFENESEAINAIPDEYLKDMRTKRS